MANLISNPKIVGNRTSRSRKVEKKSIWTLEYALYRTVKIKGKLLEPRKVISGSASLVVLT